MSKQNIEPLTGQGRALGRVHFSLDAPSWIQSPTRCATPVSVRKTAKGTGVARNVSVGATHPRKRSTYDARIEPIRGFLMVSHKNYGRNL